MATLLQELFQTERYWLTNAHVPAALLRESSTVGATLTREGLCCVDLEIQAGVITQVQRAGAGISEPIPTIDLRRGIVLPCFVDMHTHLDKGHTWERSPNGDGTFDTALSTVKADSQKYWEAEDVYRRMQFGLRCSYAHGTRAIRTHIDSFGTQADISVAVFKTLQAEWADRLTLQAVTLTTLDYFQTPAGERLADLVAEAGGVLGGLPLMAEELDAQLDRVFELAKERQLDLDFHTDESGNPDATTLRHVAEAALRHEFSGQIVCGHCCSLAVQPMDEVVQTLELVRQANIGIVSLPTCNLYLQDRQQSPSRTWLPGQEQSDFDRFPTHTPRWRGVTLLHELKHYGIPVAVASDNCRDPFFGFGDHDVLEVFNQSVRIAHLDAPYGDWCRTVTTTPATLMRLPQTGRIEVGQPADIILFQARYFSELLSRHQGDRIVLRQGKPIDTTLPNYEDLDDLWERDNF